MHIFYINQDDFSLLSLKTFPSATFLYYRDEVLDVNELACDFIKDIEIQYPNVLNHRYQIELDGLCFEKLEQIAIKKNFLLKGGDVDFDRACYMVLDDFRKNRLGNITLL